MPVDTSVEGGSGVTRNMAEAVNRCRMAAARGTGGEPVMPDPLTYPADRFVQTGLGILQLLLDGYRPRNFAVRLWDGTIWGPEEGQTALFTLVIHRPGALRRMFLHPTDLSLGNAYIHGDFDIEGDFESSFALADYFTGPGIGTAERVRCAPKLLMFPADDRPPSGRQAASGRGPRPSPSRGRSA